MPTSRRLILSPLLLAVALASVIGVATSSAAAGPGPETRVRANSTVTVDAVGQRSSETAGGVGCLRPAHPDFVSAPCVATDSYDVITNDNASGWQLGGAVLECVGFALQLSALRGGFQGIGTLRGAFKAPIPAEAGELGAGVTRSLATEADEAVFWSGIGPNGDATAAAWVAKHGGKTLEMLLAERGIPVPTTSAGWDAVSAQLASGAKGDVIVLQQVVREQSTWFRIEFRALKLNPNVTSITAVDPATGARTVLWIR